MKSNSKNNNDEIIKLKKENEELKTRLSINKKIIQEFFKNSNMSQKASVFVENIKKENSVLLSKIETLKKENENISKINYIPGDKNKSVDIYENKLFVYENLLKEKQSIIINLKEQNNTLNQLFQSKINKDKIKFLDKNIEQKNALNLTNNINNNNDINNNNISNNELNKCFIEEIYVTSPHKVVNTLNDKVELYKSVNQKLKNLIHELKENLSNKEKEYNKLEEEALKIKQELQKCTQMKNNEDIINQLIQYQSMKSIPISQSCSNFKIQKNEFNNNKINNTRNKTKKTRSSSYIMTYSNNAKKEKIMKEIENYENINKTVKEITDNDFDLAGEWADTLKHCGMTQEEFLRFCELNITNKLTNAIEYLYKILIDKNIQIKLLTQENEALNEENIRLNKINIEMESMIEFYQKNKNKKIKNKTKNDIIIQNNNNNNFKNQTIIKNNSFFDDYKNKFLNVRNKNTLNFNNNSSQNELQSTFVNVDNNITHTNININMMMDYDHINDINKNSITSSEFRDGLLLNELNKINNNKFINKDKTQNNQSNSLIKPKKINKSKDKALRYLKMDKRKIKNRSYNKLIIDRNNNINNNYIDYTNNNINDNNEKTQNISTIKKSCKNFDKINEYNRTIKNIFSNTEKMQIKNIKKNINTKKINNINLNADRIMNNLKLLNKNKYKINEDNNTNNNNHYKLCKSENNKIVKLFKKQIKIKLNK